MSGNNRSNIEIAVCNSCGKKQDARLGFECLSCGGQTFTKKEEDELRVTRNTKFVPLK